MLKLSLALSAFVTLFLTSLCLASTASIEVVLYVDDDAPPGGDGMSWDTAYRGAPPHRGQPSPYTSESRSRPHASLVAG